VQGVGEGHLAVLVVVAVALAVGGDVGELGAFGRLGEGVEAGERRRPKSSPLLSRPSKAMAREPGPS
jgi:hypothetical protein